MFSIITTLQSGLMTDSIKNLWLSTGFMTSLTPIWQNLIMMVIACVLIYLAVAKEFEPNLLLAIGFGMFIINIPGAYNVLYGTPGYTFTGPVEVDGQMINQVLMYEGQKLSGTITELSQILGLNFKEGTSLASQLGSIEETIRDIFPDIQNKIVISHEAVSDQGLFFYLYKGVEWVIYPPLIFLGIGAMTDFGPLIANPKSLIMGAAAQLGIFVTFIIAINIGFTGEEAAALGIIGGADGPTAIYVTVKLAAHLLPAISVAAYSYMALIKVIQPPIMKLMTTKKERGIVMEQLRPVSKTEKIVFPIAVTGIVGMILPSAIPLWVC